jgi:hypothetical protein
LLISAKCSNRSAASRIHFWSPGITSMTAITHIASKLPWSTARLYCFSVPTKVLQSCSTPRHFGCHATDWIDLAI